MPRLCLGVLCSGGMMDLVTAMHGYRLSCLSLGLVFYVQASFSRPCNLDPMDLESKTSGASLVVVGRTLRIQETPNGVFLVQVKVSDVLKGELQKESVAGRDRYPTVTVGFFARMEDPRFCLAQLPELGSRHILFLRSTGSGDSTGSRSPPAEGVSRPTDFLISSFPEPLSEETIKVVRNSAKEKNGRKQSVKMPHEKMIFLKPKANVTLRCLTFGKPKPKVRWFKDDIQLRNRKAIITIKETQRGSLLTIRRLTANDSGVYQCRTVDLVGRQHLTDSVRLLVIVSSHLVPCNTTELEHYCLNGECYVAPSLSRFPLCQCRKGYDGNRCQTKVPDIIAILGRERDG